MVVSMNLFLIRSNLLSSNMLTRFRPVSSRFFWSKSATNSSNDIKKKELEYSSGTELLLWTSGIKGHNKDVKVSLEDNTVYVRDHEFEKIKGTDALEQGECEFYSPDTTYKIDIEAEMQMDSASLKLG